jgi:prepilin-type processing-associated H-X9-DG protein
MPVKFSAFPVISQQQKYIPATQTDRHRGSRINVVFCDGHAEGIFPQDWSKVRVSPYQPVTKP